MMASSPSELIVEGTIDYWIDMPVKKRISYLLKDSDVENKTWLGRQAELANSDIISVHTRSFSKKGQYPFRDKSFSLEDNDNNNLWVFSHDNMLLQGVSIKTGKVIGWLGINGFIDTVESATDSDRFNSIPFMLEDRFIATQNTIYFVDFEAKNISIKTNMPDGEYLVGRPTFRENYVSLVSDKQIYLFEPRDFFEEYELATPAYSLPHPKGLSRISAIDTYKMVDGFLLAYYGRNYNGFDKPGVELIYAKQDDKSKTIYNAGFEQQNHPALIRHFEYMMSPLLHTLDATIDYSLRAYPNVKNPFVLAYTRDIPVSVNVGILILHILSISIVLWISRLIRLEQKKIILWVILTVLIGLPALLSFFFLNNVRGNIFTKAEK